MLFRNFLLLVILVGFGGNAYALFDPEANVCKIDNWNDSWGGKVNIKNICNVKLLDKETAEAIMNKLEDLDLSKPVRTAVEGTIQGFKKELEGSLKPLFDELKGLLETGTDQADKLIEGVDQRLEKRLAQIADEIRKTVKSFREDIVAIIEQTEKSVINVTKQAEDSTKNLIKQTEASVLNIEKQLIADLKDMTASLNTELSKKFETIRTNIKADIKFVGDYVSCKTYATTLTFEEALKNIVTTLPFTKTGQKACQSCEKNIVDTTICSVKKMFGNESCSVEKMECVCCDQTKLSNSESPMKLFRYNMCMRKNDLTGDSSIRDVLDVYADIHEWTTQVFCKSDMTKVGTKLLLVLSLS